MEATSKPLKPLLRWAGGKQWLAKRLCRMIPDGIGTYYEPFLGGGSLFFAAAPRLAILSDLNARLIETYQMLKSDPDAIIKILTQWANDTVTYYKIRESNYTKRTFRAAQLIYLNRTCWNGLYRVNQAGRFNVPFGNHGRSIFDRSHVLEVANALKNATLLTGDFADIVAKAGSGDFVYFDPPYTTLDGNSGFSKYNESMFTWGDQKRLGHTAVTLAERGCHVIVSNANYDPILALYPGFCNIVVSRQSILAANSKNRRKTSELVLCSSTALAENFRIVHK